MDRFMFVSYLLIWALWLFLGRSVFLWLGILDKPGKDVPKRNPVPTLQWVSVIGTFILLLFFTKEMLDLSYGREFLGLFVGWGLIALVAIIDEMWYLIDKKYALSAWIRFAIQIAVAVGARYFSGVGVEVIHIPGLQALELSGFTSLLATVGRFVLFINAINWFDGIYGLASGMSSIGFLTIFLLLLLVVFPGYEFMSLERNELLLRVKIMSLVLFVVSLLGTIMEYKPWWLMRDVGTMFLWFALWYLSLLWWAKIWTIVVVLALPLFDAVRVIIDRYVRGKNPLKGDYSHLHYRLLWLGRNRAEVRWFIRGWSLFFMTIMLLLWTDRISKLIIFCCMAFIFFAINIYLYWIKWLPAHYTPPKISWKT